MGHIIRTDNNDPLRQVTFLPNTATPNFPHIKRVGRPRLNWVHCTKRTIYETRLHRNHTVTFVDNVRNNNIIYNQSECNRHERTSFCSFCIQSTFLDAWSRFGSRIVHHSTFINWNIVSNDNETKQARF